MLGIYMTGATRLRAARKQMRIYLSLSRVLQSEASSV